MPNAVRTARQLRLEQIAERHLNAAWRVARRCGVPSDQLDDVVQEVFIIVSRKLDEISLDQERAFVTGTTVRVAANLRRSLRRRLEEPLDTPDLLVDRLGEVPQEALSRRREGLQLLDAALTGMTDGQREVFVLCELEELTAREIGQHLGMGRPRSSRA
jgi:RNA polymerase sigma-70 factor (ECF subfamily)